MKSSKGDDRSSLVIPGTAREIVAQLITQKNYTIPTIAEAIGVHPRTISRIYQGEVTLSSETNIRLLIFYLSLNTVGGE